MEKKTDIEKYELALAILAVGIFVRSVLTALFLYNYGVHAARGEFWHWYAVARGLLPINPLDPTKWLFDLTSLVFGSHLDYGLMILGIVLSSLTGVLIFFLVDYFYERRIAFLAGMIYTLMEESIYYGVAGFVHDLVQIPLMILSLLFVIKATKSRDWTKKLLYASFAAIIVYLGLHASKSIYMVFGILFFYFILAGLPKLSGKLSTRFVIEPSKYYLVILLALAAAVLFSVAVGPKLFDDIFGTLPQGRYGSGDIAPVTFDSLWLRINIFLYFIPAGILATYRRRDNMTLAIILTGLIVSGFVTRGTRILGIGLAIAIAHAFTGWKKQWTIPSAFLYLSALILVTVDTNEFDCFIPLYLLSIALIATFALLEHKGVDVSMKILPFVFVSCFLVSYIFLIEDASINSYYTEAEYFAHTWLSGNNNTGKLLLINWGRGDMASTIANISTTSNFNRVQAGAHKTLWQPEKKANKRLKARQIDYVMVTSRDFFTLNDTSPPRYFAHGLTLEPPERFLEDGNGSTGVSEVIMLNNNSIYKINETVLNQSTVYMMRYQPEKLKYFSLVYESDNGYMNTRLFKVE